MRQWFAVAVAIGCAGGCKFEVAPVGFVPIDGGGGFELAPSGEAGVTFADFAGAPSGFMPSHIDPSTYVPSTAVLDGVSAIDTTALTLAFGGPPMAPPDGVTFVHDPHGWAVLSVGTWNVDRAVAVTGGVGLIVIADSVAVDAVIDAAANLRQPGPGGSLAGDGVGSPGGKSGSEDAGGGGGGFGAAGASGGDTSNASGGAGGAAYGVGFDALNGGSGGGDGSNASGCSGGQARGGAGGGMIQISAASGLSIAPIGGITVGGGGGGLGCGSAGSAGGGGGSGGEIFLESPTIIVGGTLAANGGAGGGAGIQDGLGGTADGADGANGALSAAPAKGGAAGNLFLVGSAGGGGDGAAGSTAPGKGGNAVNGGGGGGGTGRIWLRTRMTPFAGSGTISPAPMTSTSL
ncbi:MAG TPA: hypothetical protein VFF06_14335 [Polyangia bacterium]|nr:hypothetical protein [Polyangia bacterium]